MIRLNLNTLILMTLALLLAAPCVAHAAESYDNCTGFITSIPAVVTTPGTWCLKQDLSTAMTSGNAIDIQADNVTIDCNDFKIGGLAAGLGTQTNGIHEDHRLYATVRHCNVRGFYRGVNFEINSAPQPYFKGSHLIEDNRFDGITFMGIAVNGQSSIIRRNRVSDTGGSAAYASAAGIGAVNEVDVLDNTISGVLARSGGNGSAAGIDVGDAAGSIIGNRVRGVLKDGTGLAQGINFEFGGNVALRNNDLVGDGSAGSVGMRCLGIHARAQDNVINGFATGLSSCSDDGGNVIAP